MQTLLLVCAALLATSKAEKMEFDYYLDPTQATCFLEYMGEGVQGKYKTNSPERN